MTPQDIDAIEQACTRLVNRFSVYNDQGEFAKLASLFSADGAYARPTAPDDYVHGRAAIEQAFASRPRDKLTRHVISNIVIDVIDQDRARGQCYVTLYTAALDNPAKLGLKANPAQLVGEFFDEFIRTPQGWRFARRSGNVSLTVE